MKEVKFQKDENHQKKKKRGVNKGQNSFKINSSAFVSGRDLIVLLQECTLYLNKYALIGGTEPY